MESFLLKFLPELIFGVGFIIGLYKLSVRIGHVEKALKKKNGYKNYNPNKKK